MYQRSKLDRIRRFLAVIILVSLLGIAAELLVVNHIEDPWQWTPVVLIAVAVPALIWLMAAPGVAAVRTWQALMFAFIIAGCIGLWLHWQAKMEFKHETNPSLAGVKLFWESMKSVSPPALAPGAMIQLALLGLTYAYGHAGLGARAKESSDSQGETQ